MDVIGSFYQVMISQLEWEPAGVFPGIFKKGGKPSRKWSAMAFFLKRRKSSYKMWESLRETNIRGIKPFSFVISKKNDNSLSPSP